MESVGAVTRMHPSRYDAQYRTKYYFEITKADPEKLKLHRERGNANRKATREWLAAYKLERGCKDCGYREYACALQLDHEGVKSAEIANCRTSISRLLEEIEKGQCAVRCANCHSIKTWRDKNRPKEQQQ